MPNYSSGILLYTPSAMFGLFFKHHMLSLKLTMLGSLERIKYSVCREAPVTERWRAAGLPYIHFTDNVVFSLAKVSTSPVSMVTLKLLLYLQRFTNSKYIISAVFSPPAHELNSTFCTKPSEALGHHGEARLCLEWAVNNSQTAF